VVSNTVTATQVDGCGLQDIEVPEFPVMGVSHDISVTVRKDASPTDDGVALFALDIYDNWPGNTGNPAIVTQQFVQTLSKIDRQKRTVSWTPSVPGPHTLQFDCGNTTEFATAFVTPEVVFPAHTAANRRVVAEGSGWDFAYRDDGVVPAVTDTNDYRFGFEGLLLKRISAWAYAEGTGFIDQGEDSADFDFTLRKTFRLDDKTGSSDLYTGKLIIDLGWMGWADQADYKVGDASYQVTGYIGIEEVGTDPEDVSKTCGDDKQLPCRSVVFQKPTANDEFADAAVDTLLTGFGLFPPTRGAATVGEIAVAIARAVICEGQFFNLFASRPRARHGDVRHPFELEDIPLRNGVEYNLYLRVKTSLWAEGPGESYSDFYDHDPQNCFDSSRMESLRDSDLWTPGLWIDFISIEPASKSP
jgi:hypothetical protein